MGNKLVQTSLEIRKQITNMKNPADPFKIMGNLYFVGVANGESYLLTSPQGHILLARRSLIPRIKLRKTLRPWASN